LHWYQTIERLGTGTPFEEVSVSAITVPLSAVGLRIGTPIKFGFSKTMDELPDQTVKLPIELEAVTLTLR
jgi:hypothetical protein